MKIAAIVLILVGAALRFLAPDEWTWALPVSYVFFVLGMVGVISGDLKDRKARRAASN